jgi:hypothetical protein
MVETEVEVVLTRSSSSDRSWDLRVVDSRSRIEIVRIRLDNDTFADMMSGTLAGRVSPAEVSTSPRIGKWREVRVLHASVRDVPFKTMDQHLKRQANELLATDPVLSTEEGWVWWGYSGGGGGSMRRELRFVRHVDQDPGDRVRR